MSTDPKKDLEQRGLDQLNTDRTWILAHLWWMLGVGAALVVGFILGKVV